MAGFPEVQILISHYTFSLNLIPQFKKKKWLVKSSNLFQPIPTNDIFLYYIYTNLEVYCFIFNQQATTVTMVSYLKKIVGARS
jgi:hypothetical protein